MRWRIEKEVVTGKGQFVCANKKCDERYDIFIIFFLKYEN